MEAFVALDRVAELADLERRDGGGQRRVELGDRDLAVLDQRVAEAQREIAEVGIGQLGACLQLQDPDQRLIARAAQLGWRMARAAMRIRTPINVIRVGRL